MKALVSDLRLCVQMVRLSAERDLGDSSLTRDSLSDSLEESAGPATLESSDSGLEQSGDELEPPHLRHRRHHHEEEHEADFEEDDIDLDQEIPGLNSDDEDDEDVEKDDDVDSEMNERKGHVDVDLGSLPRQRPSRIPGGVLLRRYDDDDDEVDIARLEEEMSEPGDLQDDQIGDSDTEEPLGKEKTTAAAITKMLSRLAVEGGPDYHQDAERRDMTIR